MQQVPDFRILLKLINYRGKSLEIAVFGKQEMTFPPTPILECQYLFIKEHSLTLVALGLLWWRSG